MSPTIYLDYDDKVQVSEHVTEGTTFVICPECGETYTREERLSDRWGGDCPGCLFPVQEVYPHLLEWQA